MPRRLHATALAGALLAQLGCGTREGTGPVDARIDLVAVDSARRDAPEEIALDGAADVAHDSTADIAFDGAADATIDAARDTAAMDGDGSLDAADVPAEAASDALELDVPATDLGPPPPIECPPADYDAAASTTGPSLSADLQPIFDAHCNCHQRGQAPDLRPGRAYASLYCARLAVPCPTTPWRAVPGDPEHSGLYVRVRGAGCFEQMPLGLPALPPEDIDAIRAWLAAGAAP